MKSCGLPIDNRVLRSSVLAGHERVATRLQLARRYRQSKYVLEHISHPSQLRRRSMDLIFRSRANDREFFVSRMDAVASKRSAYNVTQDHGRLS